MAATLRLAGRGRGLVLPANRQPAHPLFFGGFGCFGCFGFFFSFRASWPFAIFFSSAPSGRFPSLANVLDWRDLKVTYGTRIRQGASMRKIVRACLSMALGSMLVAVLSPARGGGHLTIIHDGAEPIPPAKVVEVTVANSSTETLEGLVTVQAIVDGKPATSSTTIVLKGGQTATAVVSFASTVQSVTGAGIIEDPDPI
jgi:hypothetical protein